MHNSYRISRPAIVDKKNTVLTSTITIYLNLWEILMINKNVELFCLFYSIGRTLDGVSVFSNLSRKFIVYYNFTDDNFLITIND